MASCDKGGLKLGTTSKDYYAILGVDRKATKEEIKTAYHKGARKNHPDLRIKSEKAAAEERFKVINEAYEQAIRPPSKRSL